MVDAVDLDWPKLGPGSARGVIRDTPDDFFVCERLGFQLSGSGEHLYVHVRKRDITTRDVKAELADLYGVPPLDVSYAGMKDKRAVAEQWFSVRCPQIDRVDVTSPKFAILTSNWHRTKLRRGELQGNRFSITVRSLQGAITVDALRRRVPNYFGPQRFGRDGSNIASAKAWVCAARPRVSGFKRGLHISTLRSFLFNEVLAERVVDGTWNTFLPDDVPDGPHEMRGDSPDETPGELSVLPGKAPAPADDQMNRCVGPTGPLWGRGRPADVDVERRVLEPLRALTEALEFVGVRQQRRGLGLRATECSVDSGDSSATLGFFLPKGCYATSILRELGDFQEPAVRGTS
ncbi:MAG: tRNA pseudouridine(13) synthase TruD [Gammaproteobacteria bacterium]|nr:tRNA pseudouridine(13) synthase TruD [Gammaproteobacteria bacterium]